MNDTYMELVKIEIDNFSQAINYNEIEKAAAMIFSVMPNARLHFTGIGKPSYVAKYASSLYSSTGIPSYFLDGTEAVHGSVGQVREGDVVIAISNSGETQELKATIQSIRNKNAKIISITGNPESYISKFADVSLVAHADHEGGTLDKAPKTSIILEMLVVQILCIRLQEMVGITKEEYFVNHPGGSLGQQVGKEIKE